MFYFVVHVQCIFRVKLLQIVSMYSGGDCHICDKQSTVNYPKRELSVITVISSNFNMSLKCTVEPCINFYFESPLSVY